jgi:hypothetical protein
VLGLDDQVHVGALQAEVNHAKPRAQRRDERGLAHRLVQLAAPQAANCRDYPHHHVQRLIRLERRARVVTLAGARPLRFAPGAAPFAAVAEQLLLDMPLARARPLRSPRRHGGMVVTNGYDVN